MKKEEPRGLLNGQTAVEQERTRKLLLGKPMSAADKVVVGETWQVGNNFFRVRKIAGKDISVRFIGAAGGDIAPVVPWWARTLRRIYRIFKKG